MIVLLILMILLSLTSCPVTNEYLFKVRGKVIDWLNESPIISAEIFVESTQYSELSNNEGDYEIELFEGTWEITIRKQGYLDEIVGVTLNSSNPREEITTRLKPEIDSPVFPNGEPYKYVLYNGIVYAIESSGSYWNTIKAYDISDWYNVIPTGSQATFDNSWGYGVAIEVDNSSLWIGTRGNDYERFYKYSLPTLALINQWDFSGVDHSNSGDQMRKKDNYLMRTYAHFVLNSGDIGMRTYNIGSGNPVFESETLQTIGNFVYHTGFSIRGFEIISNIAEFYVSWHNGAQSIFRFDVTDPTSPAYIEQEDL